MTPAASHPYPAYRPSGVPWLGDVPEHWGHAADSESIAVQINPAMCFHRTKEEELFDMVSTHVEHCLQARPHHCNGHVLWQCAESSLATRSKLAAGRRSFITQDCEAWD